MTPLFLSRLASEAVICAADAVESECGPTNATSLIDLIHTLLWIELGNIQYHPYSNTIAQCEIFQDVTDNLSVDSCKYPFMCLILLGTFNMLLFFFSLIHTAIRGRNPFVIKINDLSVLLGQCDGCR